MGLYPSLITSSRSFTSQVPCLILIVKKDLRTGNVMTGMERASRFHVIKTIRHFLGKLGPGLITGAADDDPSGISTYSIAGASFGFVPLWSILAWALEALLRGALGALIFGRFCLGSYLFLLFTGQIGFANRTLPWAPTDQPSRSEE